jgi:sulfonate transport system ATP-binding protein
LTRIEMQRLIENLWLLGGFTVILITHDVDEAVTLADRVLLIDTGCIVREWPVTLPRPRERTETAFGTVVRSILDAVLQPNLARSCVSRQDRPA